MTVGAKYKIGHLGKGFEKQRKINLIEVTSPIYLYVRHILCNQADIDVNSYCEKV